MIPDFQTLMRPVLQSSASGERRISDVVSEMADAFDLTEEERLELLPSGRQARIANRVHWAKSYLKQAGLVRDTRRGHFEITPEGRRALAEAPERITMKYLERYPSYLAFQSRTRGEQSTSDTLAVPVDVETVEQSPTERLESSYRQIRTALAQDVLDRLIQSPPSFFEDMILQLMGAMGYGSSADAGKKLGKSGDDGVDGVINEDALGVDQIYLQAKRYAPQNKVSSADIRNFYGALGLKDVTRGVFVTTSSFSPSAIETADKLGARIVLVDGQQLAELMIDHQIGCRVKSVYRVAEIDESFFE